MKTSTGSSAHRRVGICDEFITGVRIEAQELLELQLIMQCLVNALGRPKVTYHMLVFDLEGVKRTEVALVVQTGVTIERRPPPVGAEVSDSAPEGSPLRLVR